jgi:hypothetical protein
VWNGPDGDARFVGEYGEVWRWTPGAAAPVQEAKDLTAETLFGIWGSSATDIWAVGGRPLMGGEKDVLLHSDGTRWERLTVPEPKGIAFYKVWGASADDVWVCGQGGWILRIRGGIVAPTFTWYRAQPGRLVFTISGNAAGEVWAVATPAGLYHYDAAADAFETVEPPFPGGGLNGVSVAPGGDVWVVGSGGTKWQRKADGTWVDHTLEDPRGVDLHAVYATDDGAAVVGGHFNDPVHTGAERKGVLAVFNGRDCEGVANARPDPGPRRRSPMPGALSAKALSGHGQTHDVDLAQRLPLPRREAGGRRRPRGRIAQKRRPPVIVRIEPRQHGLEGRRRVGAGRRARRARRSVERRRAHDAPGAAPCQRRAGPVELRQQMPHRRIAAILLEHHGQGSIGHRPEGLQQVEDHVRNVVQMVVQQAPVAADISRRSEPPTARDVHGAHTVERHARQQRPGSAPKLTAFA